jgi:hypothetical protein
LNKKVERGGPGDPKIATRGGASARTTFQHPHELVRATKKVPEMNVRETLRKQTEVAIVHEFHSKVGIVHYTNSCL